MRAGLLLVFFAFLLFLSSASALSVYSDRNSFLLGDGINFKGACEGDSVRLAVSIENKALYEKTSDCIDNAFSFSLNASENFPSGNWRFVFSDSFESEGLSFFVLPKPEKMLIVMNLLMPLDNSIKRKSSNPLRVQLLFGNNSFDNADVFFWDASGEIRALSSDGNGIFSSSFDVPADFAFDNLALFVTAVSKDSLYRGQIKKYLSMEQAEIILNVAAPSSERIAAGISQDFSVDVSYADGSPLEGASVFADFGKGPVQLSNVSGTRFSSQVVFDEQDIGPKAVSVSATDSYGNSFSKQFNFFIESSFWQGIGRHLVYIPVIIGIVLLLAFVLFIARKKSSEGSRSRREVLLKKQVAELQSKYFKERTISEEYYRKKLNELNLEISELKRNN